MADKLDCANFAFDIARRYTQCPRPETPRMNGIQS